MTSLVLASAMLASCGSAEAGEDLDVIRLVDGTTLRGRILETRDGRYWIESAAGTVTSVAIVEVDRVDRAPPALSPPPVAAPPVLVAPPPASDHELFRAGFEVGSGVGLRVGWNVPGIHTVDVRAVLGAPMLASYPSLMTGFLVGPSVSFVDDAAWHPELGVSFGTGMSFSGELYPVGMFEVLALYDQPDRGSPFEFRLGLGVGTTSYSIVARPVVSAGWTW